MANIKSTLLLCTSSARPNICTYFVTNKASYTDALETALGDHGRVAVALAAVGGLCCSRLAAFPLFLLLLRSRFDSGRICHFWKIGVVVFSGVFKKNKDQLFLN